MFTLPPVAQRPTGPVAPLPPETLAATPAWFRDALAAPHEERWCEVAGAAIHYLRWGGAATAERPGVLLVHGASGNAYWWAFLAPLLAREFAVAAIDLSGMGDSDHRPEYQIETFARELVEVAADAGLGAGGTPPILVGHSFGGVCGVFAAHLFAECVSGLIIVDTPITPPDRPYPRGPRESRPHRIYPTLEEALGRFRLAPPQPCENVWLVDYIARTSLRAVTDPQGRPGFTWKFDPGIYNRAPSGELGEYLTRIRCRAAVLRAELSLAVPPEIGATMYEMLGGAAPVIEIPQAHHHIMLDQPLALLTALRALLHDWAHSTPTRRA